MGDCLESCAVEDARKNRLGQARRDNDDMGFSLVLLQGRMQEIWRLLALRPSLHCSVPVRRPA